MTDYRVSRAPFNFERLSEWELGHLRRVLEASQPKGATMNYTAIGVAALAVIAICMVVLTCQWT